MRFLQKVFPIVVLACGFAPGLRAQDAGDQAPPPYTSVVDGTVTVDREDTAEQAVSGAPLVAGDRIRTERGRVEILFPDASAIDVDEYSSVELNGPAYIRVTSGRVLLIVAGARTPESATRFQLDTPVASIQTFGPGEYRISLLGSGNAPQTELAVVRGNASLMTERGSMPVRAGERSVAWDNAVPSSPEFFNAARYDAFEQWASALRDDRRAPANTQYLPSELRMYGSTLDQNGSWDYEPDYGHVWYPQVAADWRPYYDGYWSPVPTYGWTWIGFNAWAWPTHHYGRWGYAHSRWFWVPERHWGPAWVSWGGAPGYVSWCPLGLHNQPVFALSVSTHQSWTGWTVIRRDNFGYRGHSNVRQYAVAGDSLPRTTPFIAQTAAPATPRFAVSRRVAGGAQAGGVPPRPDDRRTAVPRGPVNNGPQPSTDRAVAGGTRPNGEFDRNRQAVERGPRGGNASAQQPVAATPQNPDARGDRGVFRQPPRDANGSVSTPVYTNRQTPGAVQAPQAAAPARPASPAADTRQGDVWVIRRPAVPSSADPGQSDPRAAVRRPQDATPSQSPRYGDGRARTRQPAETPVATPPPPAAAPVARPAPLQVPENRPSPRAAVPYGSRQSAADPAPRYQRPEQRPEPRPSAPTPPQPAPPQERREQPRAAEPRAAQPPPQQQQRPAQEQQQPQQQQQQQNDNHGGHSRRPR